MKLADVNPNTGAAYRPCEMHRRVSSWSFYDLEDNGSGMEVRKVWHYGTLMGEWYRSTGDEVWGEDENGDYVVVEVWPADEVWSWAPLSTGWGSASDQQGLNKMLAGSGWRYVRKGGVARYVHEDGRQFPH